MGLQAFGFKKGDSVLVPSLICKDVLAPFNELGLRILFYDLNQELNSIKSAIELPKAKAIIVVHYFGFETDLSFFKDYCSINNAFLIEDNAHGLFSRNTKNELLGTIGDFGVISVRKTFPLQNGAMLILNIPHNKIEFSEVRDSVSKILFIKNMLRPLVALFGGKCLLKVAKVKRTMRKLFYGSELPLSEDKDEVEIPFEANPIDIEKRILNISFKDEIGRRKELFYFVNDFLKNEPIVPLRKALGKNEVPHSYPFFCDNLHINEVTQKLENIGLEVVSWPSLPKTVFQAGAPQFYSSLYFVKFLW